MKFPSGAVVSVYTYVYTYSPPSNIFLNLYINVPSDDYGNTNGLCGTFDSNPKNELVNINGVYVPPAGWR